MTLSDLQFIFNRAAFGSYQKSKVLLTFVVLALCGLLAVFFRALAEEATPWVAMSLFFLPVFLTTGVLLSLGILLIRLYHDEIKNKEISLRKTLSKSWEIVIGSSYFSVPIILCYLLLWMLLGLFVLLTQIPHIGGFFSVVLAFGPFLINLGSVLLLIGSLALLFFVTPALALKGFNRIQVSRVLVERFQNDIFCNLLLILAGLFPLLAVIGILTICAFMTGSLYDTAEPAISMALVWFFTMIPFTALLSPVVVFFFNFSAESHVFMIRRKPQHTLQR